VTFTNSEPIVLGRPLHPVFETALEPQPETTAAVAVPEPGDAISPQGEKPRNLTNEPKITENAVVAKGEVQAEVAANFSPSSGLDKRANEPEKRGTSSDLERRVPNHKTQWKSS
jgi:hypothetical protein